MGRFNDADDKHPPLPERATVLFLTANPSDTTRLAVGEEYRAVRGRLVASGARERVECVYAPEVRVDELAGVLQCYAPFVLHFSGHGDDEGALLLPDASGRAAAVSVEGLTRLFAALSRDLPIRCVVLNACHSATLAAALTPWVDCVIGIAASLRDTTAVAFAGAFYEALGFGRDVALAYDLACAQVRLSIDAPGDLPTLQFREGARPDAVRLVASIEEARVTSRELPKRSAPGSSDAEGITPDDASLGLSCRASARALDGTLRALGEGDAVAEGERVRLYATTTRDAYVTLLQRSVDGSVAVLVPPEGADEIRLAANVETRLPGPTSSVVFEAPFGVETLVVVVSETPWTDGRKALLRAVASGSGSSRERSREAIARISRKAVVVADTDAPEAPEEVATVSHPITLQSVPAPVR
jgi:Domain of unknown function (DUF4384)/CHAT domain